MIKKLALLLALGAMAIATVPATAQQNSSPNYELAEKFSPKKTQRLVPQTVVKPNWFEQSNKFWYAWKSVDAENY